MARIYRVAAFSIGMSGLIVAVGCSPLVRDPFLDSQKSYPVASNLGQPAHSGSVSDAPTVRTCSDAPMQYAVGVRNDLEKHAKREMWVTQYGGSALIALAGIVGYKAAAGKANSHNILALTAGGTVGYGVGTIFTSQDRINTYLAGASAVQCAISLSAPFVPAAEIDPEAIPGGKELLQYTDVRQELLSCTTDACTKKVKNCTGLDVSDLRAQLDQAHAAFLANIEQTKQIGFALCQASDGVRVKVNQMIGSKSGDISTLAVKLSAFTAKIPAPSGSSPTPPAENVQSKTAEAEIRQLMNVLVTNKAAGAKIAPDVHSPYICAAYPKISSYILKSKYLPDASNASDMQALSNSCSIASIDKTQALALDQNVFRGNAVQITAGQAVAGSVTGGSGNYTASSSNGEIIATLEKMGDAWSLKIDASGAKASDAGTVTVKDGAGQSVAVAVTVN